MAAKTADDLLSEAVGNTEKEIFSEATATDEPEAEGDRSLEEMGSDLEGRGDADEGDEATGEEGEGDEGDGQKKEPIAAKAGEKKKAAEEEPEDARTRIPRAEFIDMRKRAQKAESDLAAERETSRRQYDALNARLDAIASAQNKPAAPAKAEAGDEEIDRIFSDPKGFVSDLRRDIRAEVTQDFSTRLVNSSMAAAHTTHGETFEKAYAAVQSLDPKDPTARAEMQSVWNAPNPGEALIDWFGRRETLREVGRDPNAWLEKKLAERLADPEFLSTAVTKAREIANGQGGKPANNITRLPKSLNSASGGNANRAADPALTQDNSDRAAFDYATS